jgi:hypothetical protein
MRICIDWQNRRSVRATYGNRVASQVLIEGIGLVASTVRNESYHGAALDYNLGVLYAHLNQPEKAAIHFQSAGSPPHSGGNLLFSDQVAETLRLRDQQMLAVSRGLPPILISSMPRSASACWS